MWKKEHDCIIPIFDTIIVTEKETKSISLTVDMHTDTKIIKEKHTNTIIKKQWNKTKKRTYKNKHIH